MIRWGRWTRKQTRGRDGVFKPDLTVRAEQLNGILARERTRADRSGQPLSMVLLGYDGQSRRRRDASAIVHLMQQRARITDEIGWFDKVTGFAVLPDTPAAGGKRFAELVIRRLHSAASPRPTRFISTPRPPTAIGRTATTRLPAARGWPTVTTRFLPLSRSWSIRWTRWR